MGCASSAGMVPGAVLESKDGNIMNHAKKMLGQETTNMTDNAMGKLHEIGGAVKEKVGTVVEDIEDRVKSMVSNNKSQVEQIGSEVNGQLESMTDGFNSMAGQVNSAVDEIGQTVNENENGGSRPNSAASTAEAAPEPFPPDSLDDIKREMEAEDDSLEVTELNDETSPEDGQEINAEEPETTEADEPAEESVPVDDAQPEASSETENAAPAESTTSETPDENPPS